MAAVDAAAVINVFSDAIVHPKKYAAMDNKKN
jgi:hypothetical protein